MDAVTVTPMIQGAACRFPDAATTTGLCIKTERLLHPILSTYYTTNHTITDPLFIINTINIRKHFRKNNPNRLQGVHLFFMQGFPFSAVKYG
jgi:hypothetical protein